MATHALPGSDYTEPGVLRALPKGVAATPGLQAFWILRIGFVVAPILAGADKFFGYLTNWDQYLAPRTESLLSRVHVEGHQFMLAAGVIEIAAGIGVAIFPRIFAWVVCAWLLGIIVNLMMIPGYYDIALRDLGLALAAAALARLSAVYSRY